MMLPGEKAFLNVWECKKQRTQKTVQTRAGGHE